MATKRVILRFILILSLMLVNSEQVEEKINCKYKTCRDCSSESACIWRFYKNGAQKCEMKMTHAPDAAVAEADVPSKCDTPDCIVDEPSAWNAKGIGRLLGSFFSGVLGGSLAGMGFVQVRGRRNRAGYREIGERQSWEDMLRAFFGAFIDTLRRHNNVEVHVERADPDAERRLRDQIQEELRQRQRVVGNIGGAINQPGMGMQFVGQEAVGDEAHGVSPNRPGTSGTATVGVVPQNVTRARGRNNAALYSDDDDE